MLALKHTHKADQSGFTLIELMTTLVIAAVLLMTAVPSMVTYKRNAELTSATNTLFAAISTARGEAMKRGTYAMVVPTNNGTEWNTGWVVFVDGVALHNRTYDVSEDKTILVQGALPSYISVTGNNTAGATPAYIMFDASGYSKTKTDTFGNLTLTITRTDTYGSSIYDQTRRIKILETGRIRTCKPASASDATCSATGA
ncbi:GspH/FimT family pseudopilin [Rhodoferax sp.]|uniref:GspH/FimT family pseudopilin n=1 Tax=Rhodoferax sp. TaxID=50421 RepID=UPI00374DACEB